MTTIYRVKQAETGEHIMDAPLTTILRVFHIYADAAINRIKTENPCSLTFSRPAITHFQHITISPLSQTLNN